MIFSDGCQYGSHFSKWLPDTVRAKLVCTLLLKYWYCTIGYDVICLTMRGYSIR